MACPWLLLLSLEKRWVAIFYLPLKIFKKGQFDWTKCLFLYSDRSYWINKFGNFRDQLRDY